ncbi:MAG: hypothetical protein L0H84_05285 [Pseudonocardia sp.]|nr:hypothetical protein [Pseudonocardia sp.]
MALPELGGSDVALLLATAATLVLPGGLVAAAAGARGWRLTAAAPLLTYAIAGLTGPWTTALGIAWSPTVLVGGTLVFVVVGAAARLALHAHAGKPVSEPVRSRSADLAFAIVVAGAVLVGATAVLSGLHKLTTVPQDWDAVFHANGIRYIAETGDAGLFGMARVNWYEPGTTIFYPNAYHLVGATVEDLTGQDLPSVLNAHTALIPGLAAVVLAVLVRRFGGTSLHAAGTALAAVATSAVYDMLWRGPLLPFATGVALTPVFVILLADLLGSRGASHRVCSGLLLALAISGLMCLHPAMLFGAAVLGAPYLLWRWARRPIRLRSEPLIVLGAGAAGLALSAQQIAGALHSAASFPPADWPADLSWAESTLELLTFGHASGTWQVWLTVLAAVGLLTYARLGDLRWIGAPLAVFGVLFVLAASSDALWVSVLTRPWWNDRWRLIGLFALLAAVLVGHGLSEVRRGAVALAAVLTRWTGVHLPALGAVSTAALVVAFVAVTNGLYLDRNAAKMALNTGEGPAVTSAEIAAMRKLGRIVPDGVRVLNDRNDGSVWMYALAGVRPVAGHYDATGLGETDVGLLERRFHDYASDPAVRAAVERLDVGYVFLGEGFLRAYNGRMPGLTGLDGAPFLQTVFRNRDAVLYKIVDMSSAHAAGGAGGSTRRTGRGAGGSSRSCRDGGASGRSGLSWMSSNNAYISICTPSRNGVTARITDPAVATGGPSVSMIVQIPTAVPHKVSSIPPMRNSATGENDPTTYFQRNRRQKPRISSRTISRPTRPRRIDETSSP